MTRPTLPTGEESQAAPEPVLTDELRIVAVRELWRLHNATGAIHMDQTLQAWERMARERTEKP